MIPGPEISIDLIIFRHLYITQQKKLGKMSTGKGKEKEKPFASLLAGATAGGVESFITYPFESLKTQLQFGALNGEKVNQLPDLYWS
jgi:hypothetical protein